MEREKMKIKSFDALNDACKKNELDRFNEYSHEQKVTFLKTNGIHLGRAYGGTYIEKRNQVYIKGLKDPFSGEWFVGDYRSKVYKPKNGETIPVRIYLKKNDTNGLPHYICEYAGKGKTSPNTSSTIEINGIPVQSASDFRRETEQRRIAIKEHSKKLKKERELQEIQRKREKQLEEEKKQAARIQRQIEIKKVLDEIASRDLEKKRKWHNILSNEDKKKLLGIEYDARTNCFYIQKYIPRWKVKNGESYYSDFDIKCSEDLLLYKQYDSRLSVFYTMKIKEAVEQIAFKKNFGEIPVVLVAIPASKHDKKSNVAISIEKIAEEKSDFINWLDGSRALIRTIDVNASHLSHGDGRTTIYEHIASIQCRLRTDNMELKKLYYILIDDIITTGTTMDACEIILSRVVPKENIIRLAIGRTI